MALRGRKNSTSVTMVSSGVTTTVELDALVPFVDIVVPSGNPVPLATSYTITFNWTDSAGNSLAVTGFEVGDITVEIIEIGFGTIISTVTPTDFSEVSGDEYTMDISVPDNTNAICRIIVNSDSVFNGQTAGPPADSSNRENSFVFDSRLIDTNITGADTQIDVGAIVPYSDGKVYNGVMESVSIGNYIYSVVQTEKIRGSGSNIFVDNAVQAGAELIRANLSNASERTVIKSYDNITTAARSLSIEGNRLYWIEGSHYAYSDNAVFRDETDRTMLSNEWKSQVGSLYYIDHPSTSVSEVGLNWSSATTEDEPDAGTPDYFYGRHGGSASPIIIADDTLNLITGFSNFDDLERRGEFPVDRVGNWNWIQYGSDLNQKVSELLTNGMTGYDVLRQISIITNSIIGFKNDEFFIVPRDPRTAKLMTTLPSNQITSFHLIDYNRDVAIPDSGDIMINGEIITYTQRDVDDDEILMYSRGAHRTDAATHTVDIANDINPNAYWIDHVLSLKASTMHGSINDIDVNNDYHQLYNIVRVKYGDKIAEVIDENSIMMNEEERVLDLDTILDYHQNEWAEWLAGKYLNRLKDVHQIVDMTLKPTLYMNPGEVVVIQQEDRLHLNTPCQILSINNDIKGRTTKVKAVTL